jgi:hydroxypyruvate reductase
MVGGRLIVAGKAQPPFRGRLVLLSVGKAAVAMAGAAEERLGRRLSEGLVVTSATPATSRPMTSRVRVAGHPVPDERGLAAALEA